MKTKSIFGSVREIENERQNIWYLSLQEATNNDVKPSEQVNKTLIRILGKEELSPPRETGQHCCCKGSWEAEAWEEDRDKGGAVGDREPCC